LTATTAERFFRIDRALEPVHYVADISSHDLYIVDPDLHTSFLAPTIVYGSSDGDDLPVSAVVGGFAAWPRGGASSSPPHFSLTAAANGAADGDDIPYKRYDTADLFETSR